MFCSYGQKRLHVKRLEEFETHTDQVTNLGRLLWCVVNLPHNESHLAQYATYMGQDREYWVLFCKNHFLLPSCMQINNYHVERQCIICMFELCWFKDL